MLKISSRFARGLALAMALPIGFVACNSKKDQKQDAPKAATTSQGATSTSTTAQIEIDLPPGDGPVAKVNGVDIPRAPFVKEYKMTLERYAKARHPVQPALRERLKDNIVRRLIDAEIIKQQAKKMNISIPPAELEEKWQEHKKRYGSEEAFQGFLQRAGTSAEDVREQFELNMLREKVFATISDNIEATPQEVKEFYESGKDRYNEPEQVRASHILIRVPPNASEAEKAEKRKLAKEILAKTKAKGADFAALAKQYGEDPTRDRGGDLGYFTRGRMVKAFEDAAWALKNNQVSDVVETNFGFHIIKKTDYKAARTKTFAELKEQLERSVKARKRNEAIRDALKQWKDSAQIEQIVKGDEAIINAGAKAAAPGGMPGMQGGETPQIQIAPGATMPATPKIPLNVGTPPTTNDQPAHP